MKDPDLLQRKNDHLDIVLNPNRAVKQTTTGFERWRFEHCALPELNLDAIDLSTSCLLYTLTLPTTPYV